jgi:hypothetical protein
MDSKVTIKKLDDLGKKLFLLKEKKAKAQAAIDELTTKHAAMQEEFLDLLLQADKTSWAVKDLGTLTISGRDFFSIVDRSKFEAFAETPEAVSIGLTLELLESKLKLSTEGMGELLKEVIKKIGDKNPAEIGLSYFRRNSISKSKK